ncbi:MAG: VOC family protein [Deltaproteobacteria bacterium]|nr:VOC family protein [Deltaproteobacteria bacterium]
MIKGIQHSSYTVSNLDEALHFFCDLLGLQASPIMEPRGERLNKLYKLQEVSQRLAAIRTPNNDIIHLIEYVSPKGERIDTTLCNPGVAHIAFEVDDIQKMYDDLTAKGMVFNHPPYWGGQKIEDIMGWGVCFLKGPDGIPIELMQAPE